MRFPLLLGMVATCWLLVSSLAAPANAGHSRHPYVDSGQSADGRYVVTAELVETPADGKRRPSSYYWKYQWKDTKQGRTVEGKLQGLRSGKSSVFDPVHGHIFVAPDGQTFAVWNPQVLAPTHGVAKPPKDLTTRNAREFAGFAARLTVYRNTGDIVRQLDLKDFLRDEDWQWLYCYGCQVYWQLPYPGLDTRSAPRPGYALYRVSPDYTVLETTIGATDEAARRSKERGVTLPPPRAVRVDLVAGRVLASSEWPTADAKTPIRPFVGPVASKVLSQDAYKPSLDPLRVSGGFECGRQVR